MKTSFSQWRPIMGIFLIFLLGCGTGVLVDRAIVARKVAQLLNNGPEVVTHAIQQRLTSELSLDATQQEQLQGILSDASGQVQEARKQIQPQIRTIIMNAEQKTEAILRPDQLDRFQKVMERAKKRFGRLPVFADEPAAAPPSAQDGTHAPGK